VPLERQIRAVELQKETASDDRLVFDLDGGRRHLLRGCGA
jgi:hypothetical protein